MESKALTVHSVKYEWLPTTSIFFIGVIFMWIHFTFGASIFFLWGIILFAINHSKYIKEKDKSIYQAAFNIVDQHSKELAIRKKQLLLTKSYGLVDRKAWEKEIELFVTNVVIPKIEGKNLPIKFYANIHADIDLKASQVELQTKFTEELTPLEYENFVAATLNDNGWEARLTKASGDQGVDVIAKKESWSVAIQCKLYSNAVGNAAVQEVIAGKVFEGTAYAAVVSNSTYTRAAQQLAASAGVLLLHHEDLPDLEGRLLALRAR
jgi:restriction system protein